MASADTWKSGGDSKGLSRSAVLSVPQPAGSCATWGFAELDSSLVGAWTGLGERGSPTQPPGKARQVPAHAIMPPPGSCLRHRVTGAWGSVPPAPARPAQPDPWLHQRGAAGIVSRAGPPPRSGAGDKRSA